MLHVEVEVMCDCSTMSTSQTLALLGAVFQLAGLVWAWIALRRLWRLRWPGEPLWPRLAPFRAWIVRTWRRVWYWLTLIPYRHEGTMAVSSLGPVKASGNGVVIYADGTPEQRIERLEQRFQLLEQHFGLQVAEIRESIGTAVADVMAEQRKLWDKADADARHEARMALTWPALLAGFGGLLQVIAALT